MNDIPLIENPTEFLTVEELEFAQQGITPQGQPAPALRRACEKPEDIAQTFTDVFNDLGGHDFLHEWAQENPGLFINHLKSLAPKQQKIESEASNTLTIRHALPRSALDGYDDAEDAQIIENVAETVILDEIEEIRPPQTPKKRRRKKT